MSALTSYLKAPTPNVSDNGVTVIVTEGLNILDRAIARTSVIETTGGANPISDEQFASAVFQITGALTADATVIFPSRQNLVLIANDCTGAFSVTVWVGAYWQTIAAGARKWLWIKDTIGGFELL